MTFLSAEFAEQELVPVLREFVSWIVRIDKLYNRFFCDAAYTIKYQLACSINIICAQMQTRHKFELAEA